MDVKVDFEESGQAKWQHKTEKIIALAQLAFAVFICAVYFVSSPSASAPQSVHLTRYAVLLFPFICVARLGYLYSRRPKALFGWLSACLDIIFLTSIIYIFSQQYGTPAASMQAPSFAFYFVFIALHAMRFRVKLVIGIGVLSSAAWAVLLASFVMTGAERTHSYAEYVSAAPILVGAEIEKIISLLAFTVMLGLGVKRASEVMRDAADKHIAEVKMHEAEKTAQLKTEFLANMSHEIRTPMNGVLGMAQVLRASELRPEQAGYVDTIQRSGDALLTIINDILDFSKIEAGKLRLDITDFNLREACEDVTTLLGVTARDKGIELILKIHPDTPVNVIGDPGRLRQILTNLIGNAIKFTASGYVLCDVKGVAGDGEAHLGISVKDTGIGIAATQLKTIFDEFSQADGSTTRRFGGTGLGLSISKSLVGLMGGELSATSVAGEGSVFSMTLSLALDRRKRQPMDRPSIVDLSKIRILVVDDLRVNSDILKLQLKELGAVPDFAANARQAVQSIITASKAGRPYAVMITDFQMPDIDGLQLVQSIRKQSAYDNLQIIVLSSVDDPKIKLGFEALDICDYRTKPCRSHDLEDAVYLAAARFKTNQLEEVAVKAASDPYIPDAQTKQALSG